MEIELIIIDKGEREAGDNGDRKNFFLLVQIYVGSQLSILIVIIKTTELGERLKHVT